MPVRAAGARLRALRVSCCAGVKAARRGWACGQVGSRALSARPGDGGRTERRWMGDCPSQLSESAVRVGIAQDRAAAAVRAA